MGSWRLLSAVKHFDDGTKIAEFGQHASGYLNYTPDGTICAVLGAVKGPQILFGNPLGKPSHDCATDVTKVVAYLGTFTEDPRTGEVVHDIEWSLCPNCDARTSLRLIRLDADTVNIVASPSTGVDGRTFHSERKWRRLTVASPIRGRSVPRAVASM